MASSTLEKGKKKSNPFHSKRGVKTVERGCDEVLNPDEGGRMVCLHVGGESKMRRFLFLRGRKKGKANRTYYQINLLLPKGSSSVRSEKERITTK